jgi:hypothetical protein
MRVSTSKWILKAWESSTPAAARGARAQFAKLLGFTENKIKYDLRLPQQSNIANIIYPVC